MTRQSEVGAITRLIVKHACDAFRGPAAIETEWQALHFTAAPDFSLASEQSENFLGLLRDSGCELIVLPEEAGVGLDSIYVRDASVVCDRGVILCRMGKPQRAAEPALQRKALGTLSYPVIGSIQSPGQLEGGDVVWLDERTIAVGRGYRTNESGIAQLRALLGDCVDEFVVVPLPHWRGAGDVFHLMSMISPVDHDLAVVYSPLLPVPFREWLLARGIELIEVPDEEFATMGANVFSLAPGRCLMVAGNPITRRKLEAAGAEVIEYAGSEISLKGGGGPTCLTRPLEREGPGVSK